MPSSLIPPCRSYWFASLLLFWALGCGKPAEPVPAPAEPAVREAPPQERTTPSDPPIDQPQYTAPSSTPRESAEIRTPQPPLDPTPPVPFSSLLEAPEEPPAAPARPEFNDQRIAAAGIRKLESKHLVLYTDLPAAPALTELPQVFDLAVPQWCAYFGTDPAAAEQWKMTASFMADPNRFVASGLLPADLPEFPHAYHRGWQFWVHEQPSEYYTRHLMLHEGTHAFMHSFLGGAGPPWFMEGLAEYLGTHRWEKGELTLQIMPAASEEVPYWGRVKIIQDDFSENQGLSLENVLALGPRAHRETKGYAWSWAAVMLLAEHPLSQQAFREMFAEVTLPSGPFEEKLKSKLGPEDWPRLVEQWQLFIVHMDYGYNLQANLVQHAPLRELPAEGATFPLDATRGWQSTGFRLEAGQRYRLTATGQFLLATNPEPWPCEANGVTLRYYQGLPLGMLLGALLAEEEVDRQVTPLATPAAIGLSQELAPESNGILYVSINEHPAEWSDNSGTLMVRIERSE